MPSFLLVDPRISPALTILPRSCSKIRSISTKCRVLPRGQSHCDNDFLDLIITLFHSYLDELRKLALNGKNLTADTLQKMRDSPILLGVKKNSGDVSSSSDEEEVIYTLAKPQEIAILDDMNTYHAFSGVAVVAPQEDMLEGKVAQQFASRMVYTLNRSI